MTGWDGRWVAALVGVGCALGVLGLVRSARPSFAATSDEGDPGVTTDGRRPFGPWRKEAAPGPSPLAVLSALAVGVVCVVGTGWPVAGLLGAVGAYGLPRLLRQTSGAVSIAKVEAVATWTEMLQGTLAASAGLGQAIIATAELSPAPIRDATEQLAAKLRAGTHPRDALLQFADAVGDPCADRVVCSLLLAFTSRAQRLGELLSALADSTREEVSLRLRIETSRASVRSGVRTVVIFSVVFAAALSVLARSYLAPFGSPTGQIVLLAVGALYCGGLTLMVVLARPPEPVRLLGHAVAVG